MRRNLEGNGHDIPKLPWRFLIRPQKEKLSQDNLGSDPHLNRVPDTSKYTEDQRIGV
jgi:hypothetical protein